MTWVHDCVSRQYLKSDGTRRFSSRDLQRLRDVDACLLSVGLVSKVSNKDRLFNDVVDKRPWSQVNVLEQLLSWSSFLTMDSLSVRGPRDEYLTRRSRMLSVGSARICLKLKFISETGNFHLHILLRTERRAWADVLPSFFLRHWLHDYVNINIVDQCQRCRNTWWSSLGRCRGCSAWAETQNLRFQCQFRHTQHWACDLKISCLLFHHFAESGVKCSTYVCHSTKLILSSEDSSYATTNELYKFSIELCVIDVFVSWNQKEGDVR